MKLTCSAGAGGNIAKLNFLSNCGGLSAADGPSGFIIGASKSIFPQKLDVSFVAFGTQQKNHKHSISDLKIEINACLPISQQQPESPNCQYDAELISSQPLSFRVRSI